MTFSLFFLFDHRFALCYSFNNAKVSMEGYYQQEGGRASLDSNIVHYPLNDRYTDSYYICQMIESMFVLLIFSVLQVFEETCLLHRELTQTMQDSSLKLKG